MDNPFALFISDRVNNAKQREAEKAAQAEQRAKDRAEAKAAFKSATPKELADPSKPRQAKPNKKRKPIPGLEVEVTATEKSWLTKVYISLSVCQDNSDTLTPPEVDQLQAKGLLRRSSYNDGRKTVNVLGLTEQGLIAIERLQ